MNPLEQITEVIDTWGVIGREDFDAIIARSKDWVCVPVERKVGLAHLDKRMPGDCPRERIAASKGERDGK